MASTSSESSPAPLDAEALPLRKLKPKQQRFVDEYLVDYNATQAAIRAGYSPRTAAEQACRLLIKVKRDVEIAQAKQATHLGLTRESVLNEIRRIAFADLSDCFEENGELKNLKTLPIDVRRALASCKVLRTNLVSGDGVREQVHEVRLWDKSKALDLAAKILGMQDTKVEQSVEIRVSWINDNDDVRDITPISKPDIKALKK